jgi:dCMP deaminase
MRICESLSSLSHDPKYQVASIIATDDFREICAIGYNGDYRGGPNERYDMQHGHSNFVHGEENALIHLCVPFESRSGLILYCTHKPCSMCAKKIVNSNIRRVLYRTDYVDALGQTDEIFARSGVWCESLDAVMSSNLLATKYLVARNGLK